MGKYKENKSNFHLNGNMENCSIFAPCLDFDQEHFYYLLDGTRQKCFFLNFLEVTAVPQLPQLAPEQLLNIPPHSPVKTFLINSCSSPPGEKPSPVTIRSGPEFILDLSELAVGRRLTAG